MTRTLALVLLMGGSWLSAQTPAPGGSLSGRVVVNAASTVTPVARVLVIIDASDGQGERLAVTDREGRFRFDGVPTGRYLVRAIKV
ncbi:MAG: carboxypeptidase-like regulatory domain-containing protein, partial [Acidobacteria bacterium]|nr:carboxypeptidase-like regulatory domain-containing protein [Acidobacteriota bacterium]